MKYTSINPTTHQVIKEFESSSDTQIKTYIKNSKDAFPIWSSLNLQDRILKLSLILKKLQDSTDDIAHMISLEIGKPITQSKKEVEKSLTYFDHYMSEALKYLKEEITYEDKNQIDSVSYEAKGVAVVILPWNYPIMLFIWMVIPHLIVGNTVIVKHSENSLSVANILNNIFKDNLPPNVIQFVIGGAEEGKILVNGNIDFISFTGSYEVGQYLYHIASQKMIPVLLEMGGSNPAIVFSDYDISKAVNNIIEKRFNNTGQYCNAVKRVIVHNSIFAEFVDQLVSKIKLLKIGDPLKTDVEIGPIINQKQLQKIKTQIDQSVKMGATIRIGGTIKGDLNNYYDPTVLTDISTDMPVWREETFGPVLPIITFSTEEEAIKLANDTKYGLGAVILTNNPDIANRLIKRLLVGMIDIADGKSSKQCNPFGGVKCSGMGREHGVWGFRELTNIKSISRSK